MNAAKNEMTGEITDICLECTVVDYLRGRQVRYDERDWVYANIADCTAALSLGLNRRDSGIDAFRLPEEQIQLGGKARCYFVAKFCGKVKWSPKREDRSVSMFSFYGTVQPISQDNNTWEKLMSMIYPTTDVIEQVGADTRAFFRFTTPVIIGTIDDIVVPPSPKTVLCSISDTVGPAVIRFSEVENAEQFIVTSKLENGKHVLLEGPLEISNIKLDDNAYPCVTVSAHSENMRISFPSTERFLAWENKLMDIPKERFVGIVPQRSAEPSYEDMEEEIEALES